MVQLLRKCNFVNLFLLENRGSKYTRSCLLVLNKNSLNDSSILSFNEHS